MVILLVDGKEMVCKYRYAVVDYRSTYNNLDDLGLRKKRPQVDGLLVATNKTLISFLMTKFGRDIRILI